MAKKKKIANHYVYQKPREEEKHLIPEVVCLIGISGCGKSAYAKHMQECTVDRNNKKWVILSSDDIREELTGDRSNQEKNEEVFKTIHRRLKENLRLKNSVIIDATNLVLKNRRAYLNCIAKIPCYKTAVVFAVETAQCILSQNYPNRTVHVPVEAINRMERKFEIPFYEEGWDEIKIIDFWWNNVITKQIKPINSVKDTDFFKAQKGFDQKNKHHLYTLDKHSERVADALSRMSPNYKMCQPESYGREDITEDELYNYFLYSRELLKEVAYVHDYGKMYTGVPKDDGSGDYKYFNHHNVSAYRLMVDAKKLGMTDIDRVLDFLFYVNYHMQPFFIDNPKAEKKWRQIFGDWKYEMLMIFNQCDIIGSGTRKERVGVN